jgi:hypothetical protein
MLIRLSEGKRLVDETDSEFFFKVCSERRGEAFVYDRTIGQEAREDYMRAWAVSIEDQLEFEECCRDVMPSQYEWNAYSSEIAYPWESNVQLENLPRFWDLPQFRKYVNFNQNV